ncbi:DoxX family protein [Ferruginibacter sp. SUN002]|uniref:DoxX family protein n=1 Tax=Ferruginibacter sp. SUN002 TaxID=2937789 RepID=UPI003D368BB5
MKKLLSTNYSAGAFSAAMLLLRLAFGILMMNNGYNKLVHFSAMVPKATTILGLGQSASLALVVFAEFFCALFVIIGLFTRFAVIPLIIAMSVALFKAHNFDVFDTGEMASLYLTGFIVLLFVGPGRVSVDSMIGK